MLLCGILSSFLYVSVDVIASRNYPGYSYANQSISELSAAGAPTRMFWLIAGIGYTLLVLAFAVGVWVIGRSTRHRITASLLAAYAIIGFTTGLFFPMTPRGIEGSLRNIMHIPGTAVIVLCILLAMVFGATLLGKGFRYYTYATIAVLVVAGVMTSFQANGIAANQPTPRMGIEERVNVYGIMRWVAILALSLLSAEQAPQLRKEATATDDRPVEEGFC
jgi:Protein of unknown function (DUF998)